jgi:hypothetical protein
MKQILSYLLFLIYISNSQGIFGQDSLNNKNVLLIHFESGVVIPNSKSDFISPNLNTYHNVGFGVSYGSFQDHFLLNLRYKNSYLQVDSLRNAPSTFTADNLGLRRRQFMIGIISPHRLSRNLHLLLKANITFGNIREVNSTESIYGKVNGLNYSIGINSKVSNFFYLYFDVGYDFSGRFDPPFYSELSGIFVTFGIGVNFMD